MRVVDPTLVLLGFCLSSGAISTVNLGCGQNFVIELFSQILIAAMGGGNWVAQKFEGSESEDALVIEELSDACDEASEKTEEVEEEADEAIEEL